MKLFSATSILISSLSVARGAVPPGFQDEMHCPQGTCSLYVAKPEGIAGPKSAFYKCYDVEADELIEAVWTGDKTDVVPPAGWIQDPEDCSMDEEESGDEDDEDDGEDGEMRNTDSPGGLCAYDSDCFTRTRFAEPQNPTGPRLCQCYAASHIFTFDETEGQEHYRRARCMSDCDGFEAYCPIAPDDNGFASCALRPIKKSTPSTSSSSDDSSGKIVAPTPSPPSKSTSSSSASSSEDKSDKIASPTPAPTYSNGQFFGSVGGLCVNDSDCRTRVRSAAPPNPTGPGLCECYATSKSMPFDETEGQEHFRRARCMPTCDGFEAYCPLAPNDNGMSECALRPISDSNETPPAAVMYTLFADCVINIFR